MGGPYGTHAELARGCTRVPFGRYTWDPSGPHHGPIWAPHGQPIRATGGPHEGGPKGQLWAAHVGPTHNWPGGQQGAHSGDTRGTHMGPTMDPSGSHMGNPYGPHVGPMRVARRGSYGRPMWGPRRIGQGGHKGPIRAIHVGPIWAPPWTHLAPHGQSIRATCGPHEGGPTGQLWRPMWGPRRIGQGGHKGPIRAIHVGPIWAHHGPIWAPHGQSIRATDGPMRVAQRALYGRPSWDPDRIGQGATRGPYGRDTWDPSGPHQGPIWAPHGQSIRATRPVLRHAASPCWSRSLLKMVALELQ